jgi:hypothetical protein
VSGYAALERAARDLLDALRRAPLHTSIPVVTTDEVEAATAALRAVLDGDTGGVGS